MDGMTFQEPYLSKNMHLNNYMANDMVRTTSLVDPSIMQNQRMAEMQHQDQHEYYDQVHQQSPVYTLNKSNLKDSAIALFESDDEEAYKNLDQDTTYQIGDIEQTNQTKTNDFPKIETIQMPRSDDLAERYEDEDESIKDESKEFESPTLNTFDHPVMQKQTSP